MDATPLRHHMEYAAVLAVAGLLRALPRRVAIEVGAGIGALGWLLRLRRRQVLANLAQALPDATERQRRRIGFCAARNFGRTTAELVRFPGRDRLRLAELVRLEGLAQLQDALAGGRGAIVVTGHLAAWALYATALAAAGIPAALLVGRQSNARFDRFILSIPGGALPLISKGRSSPRHVLRCLHEGRAVVMAADQHSGPRGEVAPFLGRDASTLPLPGAIAARHGTPLCLMAGHRVGSGAHLVTLSRIHVPSGGDEAATRHAVTVACNEALGRAILAHPDQYFWYHRRWRAGDRRTAVDADPDQNQARIE